MTLNEMPEYKIWSAMKQRCLNPKTACYKRYGGRGIEVCDRWRYGEKTETGFECFISDIGHRPSSDYSIDRIDNNKGYFPENCRWATKLEQAANSSYKNGVPPKKIGDPAFLAKRRAARKKKKSSQLNNQLLITKINHPRFEREAKLIFLECRL